jgi:hypothetical protein
MDYLKLRAFVANDQFPPPQLSALLAVFSRQDGGKGGKENPGRRQVIGEGSRTFPPKPKPQPQPSELLFSSADGS